MAMPRRWRRWMTAPGCCWKRQASATPRPRRLAELAALRLAEPEAVLLAGGTDLGLAITKRHESWASVISVEKVAELRRVEWREDALLLGAGLSCTRMRCRISNACTRRRRRWCGGSAPGRCGARHAGRQSRQCLADRRYASVTACIGCKLAAASGRGGAAAGAGRILPGLPAHRAGAGRVHRGDRASPCPAAETRLRVFKVAKRRDQDISTVCGAFALRLEAGVVRAVRLAWGGMAATPLRSPRTEAALLGQPWGEATVRAAMAVLAEELAPLSDFRGSAGYRRQVAGNLLLKLWLEEGA
jgi:xanthine dehydrogenase small subunit